MSRLRTALLALAMPGVIGAILFVSAGRWDFPFVWGVLGVLTLLCVAVATFADPGMMRERRRPGPGSRDRFTQPVGSLLLLIHWILTGLDIGRFHWTVVPRPLQIAGLIGYAGSMCMLFWAVRVNPFYSSAVRVQTERGHYPISTGPYRFVRHPGYTATLSGVLSGGLALGSWIGMIPLLVFFVLFIRRTLLEDRLLRTELPGYDEYAQRVRTLLIPGIF
jgi:protein-S-isoprenylcysteine O-methyltransferase Ste14